MACKRCPHHVRHGQMSADAKTIEFKDICGLKVKAHDREVEALREKNPNKELPKPKRCPSVDVECINYPFGSSFEFRLCNVYINTFKSSEQKNDVIPTKDFQYSEALSGVSITDMELL